MKDDNLYKQAMTEMDRLANDIVKECIDFALDNDYDKEWVLDRFQERFQIAKRKVLKINQ